MIDSPPAPRQHWRTGAVWLGCFTLAALLYSATASGGPQWQDSGNHLLRIIDGKLTNPLGLALSHPLHYWLGRTVVDQRLLPPAHALTLVSALAGALAVANVGGMIAALTRSVPAALLAAGSLCFAHSFWKYSTLIETYTVTCALLSAEIWCLSLFLRDRKPVWLMAAFCYNGLGLANHNFALLTFPVLAVVLAWALARRHVRFLHMLAIAAAWIVTAAPFGALIIAEGGKSGDWPMTLHSAFFGRTFADEVLNTKLPPRETAISLAFLCLNFPNLLLIAAVIGAVRARAVTGIRGLRAALLCALAIHLVFVLRYSVPDQYTFLLPAYVLLCVLGGMGYAALGGESWLRRSVLILAALLLILTPAAYSILPQLARRLDTNHRIQRGKPYRDDYLHFLAPWSMADPSAERLAQAAFSLAGERGIIFAPDSSAYPVLAYMSRIFETPPHAIYPHLDESRAAQAIKESRRVVLVPTDVRQPPSPVSVGDWLREGDLYLLQPSPRPLDESGR